jgi:DNA-binding NarL/FixJ family response regulator
MTETAREDNAWNLSEDDWRLARLVANGRSNREIARALSLHPGAIQTRLSQLYLQLGVASRTELAVLVATSLGNQ